MSAEEANTIQDEVPVEVPQKKGKQGKYRRDKRKPILFVLCMLHIRIRLVSLFDDCFVTRPGFTPCISHQLVCSY